MSRLHAEIDHEEVGFPRVSGDEPARSGRFEVRYTFSPRERG